MRPSVGFVAPESLGFESCSEGWWKRVTNPRLRTDFRQIGWSSLGKTAGVVMLCRGSFTPVVHQPTRTMANNRGTLPERIGRFAGVFEQRRTCAIM
jgi:hypothetical protein